MKSFIYHHIIELVMLLGDAHISCENVFFNNTLFCHQLEKIAPYLAVILFLTHDCTPWFNDKWLLYGLGITTNALATASQLFQAPIYPIKAVLRYKNFKTVLEVNQNRKKNVVKPAYHKVWDRGSPKFMK